MLVRNWPQGRPRIVVSDAWLANAGDGAIALATERRLRRLAPEAAVVHAAYQGDLLADFYPELAIVPPLAALVGVAPVLPEARGWTPEARSRLLAETDAVLVQGGGFTMEHYDPWQRLLAWDLVLDQGLPLAFSAQSVGPFRRPRERAILARVYDQAVAISVRERTSLQHVLDLSPDREDILLTADEAFSLFPDGALPGGEQQGIACVISLHPALRLDGTLLAREESLAQLLTELVELAAPEHVTLLSTQQGLGHLHRGLEDDGELGTRVKAAIPEDFASRVRTIPGYIAPLRCAELIAEHRALVSMRMHPSIFALSRGLPTAMLSEAFKSTATFTMLGMDDVLVRASDGIGAIRRALALSGNRRDEYGERLQAARDAAARNDTVTERLLAVAAPPR